MRGAGPFAAQNRPIHFTASLKTCAFTGAAVLRRGLAMINETHLGSRLPAPEPANQAAIIKFLPLSSQWFARRKQIFGDPIGDTLALLRRQDRSQERGCNPL